VDHADGAHNRLFVGLAGQHDADGVGVLFLNYFQKLGAIHAGHAHIGDNHVIAVRSHELQRFAPTAGKVHIILVSQPSQHAPQAVEDIRFVIDKEHSFLFHGHSFARQRVFLPPGTVTA